jgi:hypothetical protein
MSTQPSRARPGNGRILAAAVAAALAAGYAAPASAVPIQTDNWSGSWDTTLSYGALWRVQSQDCKIIANANGGCGRGANNDDGNLNYDTGIVSNAIKGTSELELRFRDSWGFFARGTAFWDWEAGDTNRTEFSDSALNRVEQGGRMLDYFAFVPFQFGSTPGEFRVGRQVINWGESTFIQGGINVTNPFDVAQLRVPGAELREALVPQGMASVSISADAQLQRRWLLPVRVAKGAARPGGRLLLGHRPRRARAPRRPCSASAAGRTSARISGRSAAPSTRRSTSCRGAKPSPPTTAASMALRCGILPSSSWVAWSSASTTSATTAGSR